MDYGADVDLRWWPYDSMKYEMEEGEGRDEDQFGHRFV